jgi:TRAP-type mannitol/chloroaromatic compound transport system permease large subunit
VFFHLRAAVRNPPCTVERVSGTSVGFIIFGVMLALMVVRVPIGIAMFSVGAAGYVYMTRGNVNALLNSLKNLAYARLSNYDLVVIPLFLLMGQFATHGGLSRALFRCVSAFLGHRKGGIAMAAVGRVRGLRRDLRLLLATAATMGQVAFAGVAPFGYSGSLATGRARRGRHARHHDPPSVPLVIYAILTQESIGKLFMAAVLPGIIAMLGYMLVIKIMVTWKPESGPAGRKCRGARRISSFIQVFPVVIVFVVVIVGIYGGWAIRRKPPPSAPPRAESWRWSPAECA